MAIERKEPLREITSMRDMINRIFDEALVRPSGEWFAPFRDVPALDMYEADGTVKVEVALPGVKPDETEVTITGNTLMIKGERKAKEEVKDKDYYRREVRYGTFTRAVTLPEGVDMEHAEATFADGVLTVTFPKVPAVEPKRVEIKQ